MLRRMAVGTEDGGGAATAVGTAPAKARDEAATGEEVLALAFCLECFDRTESP